MEYFSLFGKQRLHSVFSYADFQVYCETKHILRKQVSSLLEYEQVGPSNLTFQLLVLFLRTDVHLREVLT